MTTTATEKAFDASAKLDELEAAAAPVEERVRELEDERAQKRRILEGPDRNTPGLLDQLRDLRTSDPGQFKPDGTPVGEEGKRLAAQIAEVGPLEPLAQEIQHQRLLAAKARRDVSSFITQHIDAILVARRPQTEARRLAVLADRDRLLEAVDDYQRWGIWLQGMLAAAQRDSYVAGVEQATNFKKAMRGDLLRELLPETDESEVEDE